MPSKNASLNSKLDVPKSISLLVTGTKAPSCNFIWSAPAALNIILLSVAKSISLSASLPITKLVFSKDDIVVCDEPSTKSSVLSPSSKVTEIPVSVLELTMPPTASVITSFKVAPFTVIASASNVPSISASPDISKEPASSSPVNVTFLKLAISLLLSTTTALEAATVPAVTPSIVSSSASLISAEPITKLVPVIVVPVIAAALEPPIIAPSTVPPFMSAVSATRLSILAVPSMNKSLNSKLDVPKSMSLSVIGTMAPSCILNCCTEEDDTST